MPSPSASTCCMRRRTPAPPRPLATGDVVDGHRATTPKPRLAKEAGRLHHLLSTIHILCEEFQPPEDACRLWRGLYAGLQPLIFDLAENTAVEETLLGLESSERAAPYTVKSRNRCD